MDVRDRSLAYLDWPEVVERLAGEARSARGADAIRAQGFARDADEARTRIAEVTEIARILRAGDALPALGFPEVDAIVTAAEKGMPLGAEDLQQVAVVCEIAAGVRRVFEERARLEPDAVARVWQIAAALDPREEIAHRVRQTFDSAGEIRDSVSPELGRMRRDRESLSGRVREEIETLMRSDEFAPVLQDEFFTLRQDRYVLPLKASAKSMGLGIVHDTSRTGETVFVEPTAVVQLNNRLKVAELEILRETRRILEEITRRVGEAAPALRAAAGILTRLDVIAAKARLSITYDGCAAEVVDEPVVDLVRARHPLLTLRGVAEGFTVVANDLVLGDARAASTGSPVDGNDGAKVLVITGPNAGGKTVLLKTAGMAALLTRFGMHVPAERARIGFFDPVLADIGDQQSVMGDLSTFSAHLENLAQILEVSGHDGARPLILVDELMVGTNPEQGAALARAVLEAIADLAGLAVTTTHYDSLKALAQGDPRFRNAAMEYDLDALLPTFRLRDGVPGRSYALDIATRMGLPKGVLARARALTGAATLGLEEVIAKLESREAGLAREAEALANARRELESTAGDQRAAAEALTAREREIARGSRVVIEEAVREAREALRAIVREAQREAQARKTGGVTAGTGDGTVRVVEDARRALEETARAVTANLPEEPAPPGAPATLKPGATAYAPSLKSDVTIVTLDAKGKAKVSVGALTFTVLAAELRQPKAKPIAPRAMQAPPAKKRKTDEAGAAAADASEFTIPTATNTLDLRGLRGDEALGQVEAYLDRASLEGKSPVFVIHGFGTGALRKVVREYLARSPYVRNWKPAAPSQGGDGATVIDL